MTEIKKARPCNLIHGENIAPRTAAEARKLIGTRVMYLRDRDIDKSGRGYISPQSGTVVEVHGRNVAIDHPSNFEINLSDLREMVELRKYSCAIDGIDAWKSFRLSGQRDGLVVQSPIFEQTPGVAANTGGEATAVEFETGAELPAILSAMRKTRGTEVMQQTLRACTLSENSLEPLPAEETPAIVSSAAPPPSL